MPGMSKGRSQMKCIPWSSRLGFGCGANTPTPENITVRNYGVGQDPHRVVATVKKKNHSVFASCSALTFMYQLKRLKCFVIVYIGYDVYYRCL
jgi:hypothetical protein